MPDVARRIPFTNIRFSIAAGAFRGAPIDTFRVDERYSKPRPSRSTTTGATCARLGPKLVLLGSSNT